LVGGTVLRGIAESLQNSVRTYDFIGRYGGEEFLIIIPSCDPRGLRTGAERLRLAVSDRPIETPVGPIPCTMSIGIASAPMAENGVSELEALLKVSDEALYRAKDNGRNRVEIALTIPNAVAGAI